MTVRKPVSALIAMKSRTVVDTQISTEASAWLLQAKDFLERARRLPPGRRRNELRQVAKVLRELAELETGSKLAPEFCRQEGT